MITTKRRFTFLNLIALIALSGCAKPVPFGQELNGFVDARELLVVSLAREGTHYFNKTRYYEAEARFRKSLYLEPSLSNIRFNLATTLERVGNYQEAQEIYQELIDQEGDNPLFRTAYGRLLLAYGDEGASKKEYTEARNMALLDNDKNLVIAISQSLASLAFRTGELDEAVCEYEMLLDLSNSLDVFRHYIRLLLSLGRAEKAQEVLENRGPEITTDDSIVSLYLRTLILFAREEIYDALEFSERILATPNLDSQIEFELRAINLTTRYMMAEVGLFERVQSLSFLKILSEAVEANPLSTLYWSPQMIERIYEMLNYSHEQELLNV